MRDKNLKYNLRISLFKKNIIFHKMILSEFGFSTLDLNK